MEIKYSIKESISMRVGDQVSIRGDDDSDLTDILKGWGITNPDRVNHILLFRIGRIIELHHPDANGNVTKFTVAIVDFCGVEIATDPYKLVKIDNNE